MPGWGLPGRELCESYFRVKYSLRLVASHQLAPHASAASSLDRSIYLANILHLANFTTLSPSLSQNLSRRYITMPSYLAPSQVPETYRPLSAFSGSFDMETSLAFNVTRSHRGHSISQFQRPNHFSNSSLYICCKCNDGPKVFSHNVQCVMCHHYACDLCVHVK
ncbi:hypothetical protein BDV11DRAFT_194060 [Aspergillus similis]